MKKILYATGVLASLMAVSCVKEDGFHAPQQQMKGTRIEFVGESYDDVTKVSIGEKDGSRYPLLWQAGDVISVWSENLAVADLPTVDEEGNPVAGAEGKIIGEQAELYSETAGKPKGTFVTINPINVTEATDVVITYPGTATFVDGKVSGEIPAVQTQRGANSSLHVGNSALAFAKASLGTASTDAVSFTLSQQTAFVKLALSTSEYSDLKIKGAKLIVSGQELSGKMTSDISTGTFTLTDAKDYVGVQLRTPVDFTGTQNLYFSAAPADLSGKKVIVSVEMTDNEGLKTVTVPTTVDGGRLQASCLTVIELNVSSSSLDEYNWYEPVETRDLLNGWAYGEQNTYFVEQKASANNTISFSVKARGDFSRVKEPVKYGLYIGSSEMSTRKLCYINDPANYKYESGKFPVKSDCTIEVGVMDQTAGDGRWSVVAIYDKDDNVLWSFMICRYLEGDPIASVQYPNGISVMDRALGASYSNSLAETKKTFDNASAFFQWGRKDPTMWSNSVDATHNPALNQRYIQRVAVESDDIAYSIANPGVSIAYDGSNNISRGDWKCDEHSDALWGGNSETGVGHKTIYDPCPKGYRVPDKSILEYVQKNAKRLEIDNGKPDQPDDVVKEDSPFAGKFSTLAVTLGGGKTDYWPYGGGRWVDGGGWGNRPSSNNSHAALYWSNCEVDATEQTYALQLCYYSGSFDFSFKGANKSRAFAVRCQVDTENR